MSMQPEMINYPFEFDVSDIETKVTLCGLWDRQRAYEHNLASVAESPYTVCSCDEAPSVGL